MKELTEDVVNESNESLSDSDESIHHIEEKRTSKKLKSTIQRK